ncbi:MAG: hypothetical protein ACRBN8_15660 [Nannocystales bacterium]
MRKGLAVIVVGLLGCSPTGPSSADEQPPVSPAQPESEPQPVPEVTPEPEPGKDPAPEAGAADVIVLMTAATLADDCGGVPNTKPAAPVAKRKSKSTLKGDQAPGAKRKRAKRRCKQSSIQLAVTAPEGAAPTQITVKSVELRLASGESVGMLETQSPSVWSDADGYAPWDEKIEPGQDLSVSYGVTSPEWNKVKDRRSQTYTVKAVVSIAGSDQTLEQNVVVDVPASLPPNVKT